MLVEAGPENNEVLCSGLLNREAQTALGEEFPASVARKPFRPQLEYHDCDNKFRLRFDPDYINMDRPGFDAWLREKAQSSGARVIYNCRAASISSKDKARVTSTSRGEIKSRFVVDASGWRSLSRKMLGGQSAPAIHAFQGLAAIDLPDDAMWAMYISYATPFYGWIVPKGGGMFLLGSGFQIGAKATRGQHDNPWSKLGPFIEYIQSRGHKVVLLTPKPHGSPITCIKGLGNLWWGGDYVFPVGEAAGMVSPSSGDGISYCLQGARAVADSLAAFHNGNYPGHGQIASQIRAKLKPAMRELRFNCFKAWAASNPATRKMAAAFLPYFLYKPVTRLPFNG